VCLCSNLLKLESVSPSLQGEPAWERRLPHHLQLQDRAPSRNLQRSAVPPSSSRRSSCRSGRPTTTRSTTFSEKATAVRTP